MKREIDYGKLYQFLGVDIKNVKDNGQAVGLCPFHTDTAPSFSFNMENGLWTCFAGCGKGDPIGFLCKKFNVVREDAEDVLEGLVDPITEPFETWHQNLLKNAKAMEVLLKLKGYSKELITRFKIGYDGDRFTIPISVGGVLVNIRKYSLEKKRTKMLNVDGRGKLRIFPYENLFKGETVYLFEGESDCLLANQLGLNAITVTGGAGQWRDEWGLLFNEIGIKKVIICYDIDEAGLNGSVAIKEKLKRHVREISIVKLPINEPKNADFSNYIIDHNKSLLDFNELVNSCSKQDVQFERTEGAEVKTNTEIINTTLHLSGGSEFYFKRIRLDVIVSGRTLVPYIIPRKVAVTCSKISETNTSEIKKRCLNCKLAKAGSNLILTLDEMSPIVLKIIGSSDTQVKGFLREFAGVVHDCPHYELEIVETQNVEELRVIPDINFELQQQFNEYVVRVVYYLDLKNSRVKANSSYQIEGVVMPHPKTQAATIAICKMTPTKTDLDTFEVTEDVKRALEKFRPLKNQTVNQKINEICDDLTYNKTKMYQREDLVVAVHLIFCSALEFDFLDEYVSKGCVEGLIIGDKGCGKSKTVERLVHHFRAGEIISGENLSFAGLVGGMLQTGQAWSIVWGKGPLNNHRAMVLEEASSIAPETIENLSAVRSSGIAEVTKIQTEKTEARLRWCWITNARSGHNLNTYNHGVMAVKELIGKVEDIRRFDFAMTVTEEEVDLSDIMKEVNKKVAHKYTTEAYNKLILWIWSRKRKDIEFMGDATLSILEYTNKLSEIYSSTIPLVEPSEQRVKLARLASAVAAWTASTDETYEKIIIKKEHVDFVYEYLRLIYDKPSMAYNVYSTTQFSKTRLTGGTKEQIIKEFKTKFPNWSMIRDVLLDVRLFRKSEFVDQTGISKEEASMFFKWTTQYKLLNSSTAGFSKSPVFTLILKELCTGEHVTDATKETKGDI